jgi:chromate transporter
VDRVVTEAKPAGRAGDVTTPAPPQPAEPGRQLRAWIAIGTQSFGGGASTLYLIRTILVGRRGWLTMEDFVQDWTLSRLSPGNHLTALAALIGQRIGGRRGVLLAVAGLLVPSAVITAILTGGFGFIRDAPAVRSALAGIAPVTIGMMFGISFLMIRTILSPRSWMLVLDIVVFAIATIAGFFVSGSTIAIILAGAVFGVLFMGREGAPPEAIGD